VLLRGDASEITASVDCDNSESMRNEIRNETATQEPGRASNDDTCKPARRHISSTLRLEVLLIPSSLIRVASLSLSRILVPHNGLASHLLCQQSGAGVVSCAGLSSTRYVPIQALSTYMAPIEAGRAYSKDFPSNSSHASSPPTLKGRNPTDPKGTAPSGRMERSAGLDPALKHRAIQIPPFGRSPLSPSCAWVGNHPGPPGDCTGGRTARYNS